MKKLLLLLTGLGLLCGGLFAFGGKAPQTIVGHINFYGNEPFAYPGVVTVEGLEYTLYVPEGSEFTLKDITANQGLMLEFKGRIDDSQKGGFQVLKDGVFVVEKFKVLK